MALFAFIKDSGLNLQEMGGTAASSTERAGETDDLSGFGTNSAASERLEKMIHDHHLEIRDLSVVVEDNTVHLSGKARNQEAKEKVILLLGNNQGIEEVNEAMEVEEPAPESLFHTVARADTLEVISKNIYGDPERSQEIISANEPMVKTAADIYPGQVLRIPYQKEPR